MPLGAAVPGWLAPITPGPIRRAALILRTRASLSVARCGINSLFALENATEAVTVCVNVDCVLIGRLVPLRSFRNCRRQSNASARRDGDWLTLVRFIVTFAASYWPRPIPFARPSTVSVRNWPKTIKRPTIRRLRRDRWTQRCSKSNRNRRWLSIATRTLWRRPTAKSVTCADSWC